MALTVEELPEFLAHFAASGRITPLAVAIIANVLVISAHSPERLESINLASAIPPNETITRGSPPPGVDHA